MPATSEKELEELLADLKPAERALVLQTRKLRPVVQKYVETCRYRPWNDPDTLEGKCHSSGLLFDVYRAMKVDATEKRVKDLRRLRDAAMAFVHRLLLDVQSPGILVESDASYRMKLSKILGALENARRLIQPPSRARTAIALYIEEVIPDDLGSPRLDALSDEIGIVAERVAELLEIATPGTNTKHSIERFTFLNLIEIWRWGTGQWPTESEPSGVPAAALYSLTHEILCKASNDATRSKRFGPETFKSAMERAKHQHTVLYGKPPVKRKKRPAKSTRHS